MAPPPPFGANSAAARDIANVLHPYTDLKTHQETGPIVVTRGKGVRIWDDTGKEFRTARQQASFIGVMRACPVSTECASRHQLVDTVWREKCRGDVSVPLYEVILALDAGEFAGHLKCELRRGRVASLLQTSL